jgi:hypothetical protein
VRDEEHEPNKRCGTVGTSWHGTAKPSIHNWLCFINRASMYRRDNGLPMESCGVSWTGLREEESSLTAPQKSANGIIPPAMAGRPERYRTAEDVTRLSGGVEAGGREAPPYPD